MEKKICELKLNEIQDVVGGVIAVSYSMSSLSKPTTSTNWSSTSSTSTSLSTALRLG